MHYFILFYVVIGHYVVFYILERDPTYEHSSETEFKRLITTAVKQFEDEQE